MSLSALLSPVILYQYSPGSPACATDRALVFRLDPNGATTLTNWSGHPGRSPPYRLNRKLDRI